MKKLFFVGKAPGLLSSPEDPAVLPLDDLARVSELENAGAIQGGMPPKIAAARSASMAA